MSIAEDYPEIQVFLFVVVAAFCAVVSTMLFGPSSPMQGAIDGGQMEQNALALIFLFVGAAAVVVFWYLREVL